MTPFDNGYRYDMRRSETMRALYQRHAEHMYTPRKEMCFHYYDTAKECPSNVSVPYTDTPTELSFENGEIIKCFLRTSQGLTTDDDICADDRCEEDSDDEEEEERNGRYKLFSLSFLI